MKYTKFHDYFHISSAKKKHVLTFNLILYKHELLKELRADDWFVGWLGGQGTL